MAITVNPAIEQRIQQMLEGGEYSTVDQLLASALDRLAIDAIVQSVGVEKFRKLIDEGIQSAEREPLVTPEEARAHLARVRAELIRG